jgi:predicted aspartyl protease
MNANAPYVVFYLVATVFVASALVGRRLPLGKTLKMGLAWIAIFLVAIAIALTIGRL